MSDPASLMESLGIKFGELEAVDKLLVISAIHSELEKGLEDLDSLNAVEYLTKIAEGTEGTIAETSFKNYYQEEIRSRLPELQKIIVDRLLTHL